MHLWKILEGPIKGRHHHANNQHSLLTILYFQRYKNQPPMGFDELASEADQVIQLSEDPNGEVEYLVKLVYMLM